MTAVVQFCAQAYFSHSPKMFLPFQLKLAIFTEGMTDISNKQADRSVAEFHLMQ